MNIPDQSPDAGPDTPERVQPEPVQVGPEPLSMGLVNTAGDNPVVYSRPGRNGVRLPLGNHPGNTGGKPGRSGRPPAQLGAFLAELRASPDFHATLRKIAKNPKARNFPAVLKLLSQYDLDKPAERRETSGKLEVTVRFAREGRRITAG